MRVCLRAPATDLRVPRSWVHAIFAWASTARHASRHPWRARVKLGAKVAVPLYSHVRADHCQAHGKNCVRATKSPGKTDYASVV